MVRFHLLDVATALVKLADLHEGLWQLNVMFGQSAVNMTVNDRKLPTALAQVAGVQLTRVTEADPLTVDAAVVNSERAHIVVPGMGGTMAGWN